MTQIVSHEWIPNLFYINLHASILSEVFLFDWLF